MKTLKKPDRLRNPLKQDGDGKDVEALTRKESIRTDGNPLPPPDNISPSSLRLGVIFLGRRRPGFDMEWGRQMEERVRHWLRQTELTIVEPPEKAIDDSSLRKAMSACEAA